MRSFDLVRVWKKWVFNIFSSGKTDISGGESTVLCGELLSRRVGKGVGHLAHV